MIEEKRAQELIQQLRHEDEDVRENAAWILGRIGGPVVEAIPALIHALKDENRNVYQYAAWALEQMGEKALLEVYDAVKNNAITYRKVNPVVLAILERIREMKKGVVRIPIEPPSVKQAALARQAA